jgi:hypothetical protein
MTAAAKPPYCTRDVDPTSQPTRFSCARQVARLGIGSIPLDVSVQTQIGGSQGDGDAP